MLFIKSCNLNDLGMFESMLNEMGAVLSSRAHEEAMQLCITAADPSLNDHSLVLAKKVVLDETAANMFKDLADTTYAIGCDLYY